MLNEKKVPPIIMFNFNIGCHSDENTIDGNRSDDQFGPFTIKGTFSEKAPYVVKFNLKFSDNPSSTMDFDGWGGGDESRIFGVWKGDLGSGTFAYSPSNVKKKMDISFLINNNNDVSFEKTINSKINFNNANNVNIGEINVVCKQYKIFNVKEIFIKFISGKIISLDVESSDKISIVKSKLQQPIDQQCLLYNDKQLKDGKNTF